MHDHSLCSSGLSRRSFLSSTGMGLASVAFQALLGGDGIHGPAVELEERVDAGAGDVEPVFEGGGGAGEGAREARRAAEVRDGAGDGPLADRIELTEVLADVPGDTFIDDPRKSGAWRETSCEEHAAEGGRPPFRFVTLERA